MVRMYYNEKDLFADIDVRNDLLSDNLFINNDRNSGQILPEITMIAEQLKEELIIFEFKLSKSKEGNRDKKKYLLVSKKNLRFYNTLDEYLKDRDQLNRNSMLVMNELQKLIGFINIGGEMPDMEDNLPQLSGR